MVGLSTTTHYRALVGNLYYERYEEAGLMLPTPGAVETAPDGGLILTDGAGKSTAVPAENLPFMAGGGRLEHLGDFSTTALGTSTGGTLHSPAVVIYL